ncbi:MAG TPA: YtxH domain-containing protein [Candidatus Dormibacteraeota bacterium]|nr:YtxH domain-containing protein [Candidatus Dormibacteraeota bacterium]
MSKTAKRFAVGAVVAGVAGYLAGLLSAPKSGQQTRQDIKQATASSLSEAEKQLKALHTELNKLLEEVRQKSETMTVKTQDELQVLVDKAKDTKEKAREMLSALHEGDAQDQDLKQAIIEAKHAAHHIKDYLKR